MVSVRDECGALEAAAAAEADLRGDLVADEADRAGCGEHPEVREGVRVDQPLDRLGERDAGRGKDGKHDGEAGALLAASRAEKECDSERDSGEGVAEVVDQVGEECHRSGEREDRRLKTGGQPEDGKTDRDGSDAVP